MKNPVTYALAFCLLLLAFCFISDAPVDANLMGRVAAFNASSYGCSAPAAWSQSAGCSQPAALPSIMDDPVANGPPASPPEDLQPTSYGSAGTYGSGSAGTYGSGSSGAYGSSSGSSGYGTYASHGRGGFFRKGGLFRRGGLFRPASRWNSGPHGGWGRSAAYSGYCANCN